MLFFVNFFQASNMQIQVGISLNITKQVGGEQGRVHSNTFRVSSWNLEWFGAIDDDDDDDDDDYVDDVFQNDNLVHPQTSQQDPVTIYIRSISVSFVNLLNAFDLSILIWMNPPTSWVRFHGVTIQAWKLETPGNGMSRWKLGKG